MKKSTKIKLLTVGLIACACGAGAFAGCSKIQIKYQIEFNSNGGTACETVKSGDASSIKIPDNPERDNYVFEGWFWDDGEWEKPFTVNSILDQPISDYMNMTVYAKWKGVDVNVTLKNFDGGNEKSCTIEYGAFYELPAPLTTFEDKGFNGWAFSGESDAVTDSYGSSLAECDFLTAEFTPVWREGKVTLNFDGNGGNVNTSSKTVWQGEEFGALPRAEREGYNFDGWFTETEGGVEIKPDDLVEFSGGVTLYAHYSEYKYSQVTYDGNGATSGQMQPQTLISGKEYYLPFSWFYRDGYTFGGWEYDGEIYDEFDRVVFKEGECTVKAVWKGKTVSIVFGGGASDATGIMPEMTYVNGTGFTFPECAFTRSRYAFDGWEFYKSNRKYAAGEKIYDFGDREAVWLDATWRNARYKLLIKEDLSEPDSEAIVINAECTKWITLSKYIRERKGYTVSIVIQNGVRAGQKFYSSVTDLSYTEGDKITALLSYTVNEYQLRYPVGSASSYIAVDLHYDEEHTVPECRAVKEGYVFTGWHYWGYNVESDIKDELYQPGDKIKNITAEDGAEIKVTPAWRAAEYTLNIHSNDGRDEVRTVQCTYGETENLPVGWLSDTDKYKFIGYRVGKTVFGAYKRVDVCTEDGAVVDAYALWTYKYAGAGTEADPYIIDNEEGLRNLDDFLLADDCFLSSSYPTRMFFKLAADIDMESKEFVPVGWCGKRFYGTFDGGGHTISNLNINIQNEKEFPSIGFFSDISGYGDEYHPFDSEIKNLTLENCTVTADLSGAQYVYAGILAGKAYRTHFSNCAVTGGEITLTNGGNTVLAGGLVSYADGGSISKNCYFEGEINVTAENATIYGLGHGGAEACAANARINATCSGNATIYGLNFVAEKSYAVIQADITALRHAIHESTVHKTSSYYSAASVYKVNGTVLTERVSEGETADSNLKDPGWIAEHIPALRTDKWTMNGSYPVLGARTLETVEISSAEELIALSGKALTERYVLTADINMSGKQWSSPVVYSEFDGNGHTIGGFSTTEVKDGSSGFFNVNYGVIKNLRLTGVLLTVQSEGASLYAGGIVGNNMGTVAYCKVQGQIAAVVNGSDVYVGGIAGISTGTIYGCYTDCTLEGSAIKASTRGTIQLGGEEAFVYGIAHQRGGTVSSCYSSGEYTASAYYKVYMGGVANNAENSFSLANFNYNADVKNYEVLPVANGATGCSSQKINGSAVQGVSGVFYYNQTYLTDTVGFKSFVSKEELSAEPYACWIITSDDLPVLYYEV